jgi:uncharacterized protein
MSTNSKNKITSQSQITSGKTTAGKAAAKKPWYSDGLRFQCTGCGGCCTGAPGYVWVNKEEIAILAAVVGKDVEQFQRQYVRSVGVRKSLKEFEDGDCVFFDNKTRRCSVYSVRPRQCRTWPFWPSNLRVPQSWEEMAERCPGANRGPLIALAEIQAKSDVMQV